MRGRLAGGQTDRRTAVAEDKEEEEEEKGRRRDTSAVTLGISLRESGEKKGETPPSSDAKKVHRV